MKRLPLIAIAAFALACGEDSPTQTSQQFTGSFLWQSSVGGILGQEHTPESENVTVLIDYDGRFARVYHDDTLVDETTYTATEQPTFGPLPTYVVRYARPLAAFPFDALDEHTVTLTAPNTVRFDDPCCDRYTHTLEAR